MHMQNAIMLKLAGKGFNRVRAPVIRTAARGSPVVGPLLLAARAFQRDPFM
jgi:hypothetical protein